MKAKSKPRRQDPRQSPGAPEPGTDPGLASLLLDVVPESMQVLRQHLRAAVRDEVTHPQLRILAHVCKGTNTAARLAQRQGVSPVAISRMVDALVEKELLERTYQAGNRKQVFLQLTIKGERLYARTRQAASRTLDDFLERLPSSDRLAIRRGLLALQNALLGN